MNLDENITKANFEEMPVILEASGISKSFGSTKAVQDFSMTVRKGEIHGLVGENGSGKSTFSAVVAGALKRDAGTLTLMGKDYTAESVTDAASKGVAIVMQEIATIGNINVAANLFLNDEAGFGKCGFRTEKKLQKAAAEVFARYGMPEIPPAVPAMALNLEQRKLIELAKAMYKEPKLLIIDETSNALTRVGREHLYNCINRIIDDGGAVLFITHDMEELMDICNCVTVMRDGQYVETLYGSDMNIDRIKQLMVGRKMLSNFYRADHTASYEEEEVLKVTDLCAPMTDHISFTLHKGEILGIGGLSDCGMHELGRILFGIDRADSGTVEVKSGGTWKKVQDPVSAIGNKIAYMSKNRDAEAVILQYPIADNICLPVLGKLKKKGFIIPKNEKAHAAKWTDALEIKMRDADQYVSELSGGNKQKVVLAKWLGNESEIYIMDCPTRGIDIGVKERIYRIMEDLKKAGKAMIMISEELPELIGMSDRIMIIRTHQAVSMIDRGEDVSEQRIIEEML